MDIYIVDTSALLKDTDILEKIPCGEVIIHTIVLEELDTLSKKNDYIGASARRIADKLYKLRNRGDFEKGIKKQNGLVIKIDDRKPNVEFLRFGFDSTKNDNLLLCIAKEIQAETGQRTILLTADKFMCLKGSLDLEIRIVGQNFYKKQHKKKRYYNFRQLHFYSCNRF